MVFSRTPHIRTLRVFGLPSPRGPALTSFLDTFRIHSPIESIVPNHASRSLDITVYHAIGLENFVERKRHPHMFSNLKFQIGPPSKLPVELLAGLVLRNASRALKLSRLREFMTQEWLMEVLSKFGNVEKLQVDISKKSAVVHYMSVIEAIHVSELFPPLRTDFVPF
jgi:hypothetical protein